MSTQKTDKQALQEWDDLLDSIRNSTPVDINESAGEKSRRIAELEEVFEKWVKYYFPNYCFCEPADFQKASSQRIFKVRTQKRFYQRRAWARGLSKSTRRMFEILYLKFVKKMRVNMLLISKSYENAQRLLDNYMATLQANQRLINDYGIQERPGKWERGDFTTRDKSTFRAVGVGQNPRGAKNEELRINILSADDIDDDEVCRNTDRLNDIWKWWEQAAIPTVDISAPYYIFVDNNIISEDSIAVRAAKHANDVELVNIRDANGRSSWPEKNSEADIDEMERTISYESFQKEYYNNPMEAGKTFKELVYGQCPDISLLQFAVIYADPSPSNRDKPTAKSGSKNSCKAVVVLGYYMGKFYVYKCWVDTTTNANFVDWIWQAKKFVGTKTVLYIYIENNTLQNPFYEQVLLPLILAKSKETGDHLLVTGDETVKPDKWFRIEGTLEPLVRTGDLVFNELEINNPHMQRMDAQFITAKPSSKTLDGPDAVQGGVIIVRDKIATAAVGGIRIIRRQKSKNRV